MTDPVGSNGPPSATTPDHFQLVRGHRSLRLEGLRELLGTQNKEISLREFVEARELFTYFDQEYRGEDLIILITDEGKVALLAAPEFAFDRVPGGIKFKSDRVRFIDQHDVKTEGVARAIVDIPSSVAQTGVQLAGCAGGVVVGIILGAGVGAITKLPGAAGYAVTGTTVAGCAIGQQISDAFSSDPVTAEFVNTILEIFEDAEQIRNRQG